MNYTIRLRYKLRLSLIFILLGISAGLFFVMLNDGFGDWYPFVNGGVIGVALGLATAYFEFFLGKKWMKQRSLLSIIAFRTFYYTFIVSLVIIVEIGVARMIKDQLAFPELLANKEFNEYIYGGEFSTSVFYALALIIFVNFNYEINRKLGQGVLLSLITGRYHHPREIEKVFLFLNLSNARQIIKQIGRMQFHEFINEVIYDITTPIITRRGIIYHYVDNEMVIKWKMAEGIRNANAIHCFFEMKEKLKESHLIYLNKYGVVPEINGALHVGPVVKGEIGWIRSEIVYHGDTMNTTSRILDKCKTYSTDIIASSQLLALINLPGKYTQRKCDDVLLRGKSTMVELYSVQLIAERNPALVV
ncbi:MAG: adenylate/guanylate cyclase domain-containing protein [Cyclobacteriaceae bacterium]|nr:adenylate/guanylate cyclase domain-containing protein [Cyclobacteriaceae bacterium]